MKQTVFVVHCVKLTCIEEESSDESTVAEEGAHRGDILKVAITKRGVNECDGLHFHIHKTAKAT